jgi:dethiobiotin synthetase/adenosylmethionine--8-amino-7-oxononanoate aminotransferase
VGDPRLGGISATLTAYESLLLRGYDVAAIVLMRSGQASASAFYSPAQNLDNHKAIEDNLREAAAHRFGSPLPVFSLPACKPPPPIPTGVGAGAGIGGTTVGGRLLDESLLEWLDQSKFDFDHLLLELRGEAGRRLEGLREAAGAAARHVWWPFTQHWNVDPG